MSFHSHLCLHEQRQTLQLSSTSAQYFTVDLWHAASLKYNGFSCPIACIGYSSEMFGMLGAIAWVMYLNLFYLWISYVHQLSPKNELCLSSCLSLSVRWCVRTCQRRPCMTFFTTLNTEGNGTQTSSRPSISGNLRSMRMLVTTHVCCTLMCKHVHSFVTNMICEGKHMKCTLTCVVLFTGFVLYVNRELSETC